MKKVFLGGTYEDSVWLEKITKKIKFDYFVPVVGEDTETHNFHEKEKCDYHVYVFTPYMESEPEKNIHRIAEMLEDVRKHPNTTVFCFVELAYPEAGFTSEMVESLRGIGDFVSQSGSWFFESLDDVATFLNLEE